MIYMTVYSKIYFYYYHYWSLVLCGRHLCITACDTEEKKNVTVLSLNLGKSDNYLCLRESMLLRVMSCICNLNMLKTLSSSQDSNATYS